MPRRVASLVLLIVAAVLWNLTPASAAQSLPASPAVANAPGVSSQGAEEDWTTPMLCTSRLRPERPLATPIRNFANYTVELLQMQWRSGDPMDLYVMKPKGVAKPPVILYLYGHVDDPDRFTGKSFQETATRNGFAAVGFVSALSDYRFHDRPLTQSFVSELPESLAASAHDVQMVLDYLESRGDLDMSRVGMLAQDSGATIAILASAVDPRIKVLDTVDPWGDWPDWFASSPVVPENKRPAYLKPEFLKKVADLDPIAWLPLIQAKKFRLQDALFAPSTPPAAKDKLRLAVPTVPGQATLTIYKTPQEAKAVAYGDSALAWIKQELRAINEPSAGNRQQSANNAQPPAGDRQ